MAANESVGSRLGNRFGALQISDFAILACDNTVDLICVLVAFICVYGYCLVFSVGLECSGPAKKAAGLALT